MSCGGAFVEFQGAPCRKEADFYPDLLKTCCRNKIADKWSLLLQAWDYYEWMFKSGSLHQIGSLIMSEFAFRASKEEVARMNKLNRLIFSRSAAAVMSNTARNETLMSRENEVRWRGIDLQRWLFGVSGGGSACEWSRGGGGQGGDSTNRLLLVDYTALYSLGLNDSKIYCRAYSDSSPAEHSQLRMSDDSLPGSSTAPPASCWM